MSVYSYSQTAASNTTVGGVSVAEGMSPAGVNNAIRGGAAEIAEWRDDIGGKQSTAGSSNAYTLTTNGTVAALADGIMLGFVASFSNTGAATLNVDTLGAKAIRKRGDTALASGDIAQNGHYLVQYDASANSSAGAWLLVDVPPPDLSSYATLTGSETLTNKTITAATADGAWSVAGTWTAGATWTLPAFTLAGAVTGGDQTVSAINLKDYGEVTNAIGSIGGGTQDIDLTAGNVVSGTVDTSTTTFTFSNPTASDEGCSFTLVLTNGGSQTVNWPASVDWAGGTAPTLTTSGVDILEFFTIDGGTIWFGFAAGLDMQ